MTLVVYLFVKEDNMLRIGRNIIMAGATMLVLAAGSSIATAAVMSGPSPVDSSGVIHGCWSDSAINGSHVFVMQDAGTNCPRRTTAISWNQAGSATAGSSGLDVITVSNSAGLTGGQPITVTCPATDPYALGGGVSQDPDATPDPVTNSFPIDKNGGNTPDGWEGSVLTGATVTVYALCSR
jgi:hypothetical protein